MAIQCDYVQRNLVFNFSARTSRGSMQRHVSWIVKLWDDEAPEIIGLGECAPLPGLSIDDVPNFEKVLQASLALVCHALKENKMEEVSAIKTIISSKYPSIIFGLETAFLDIQNGGKKILFRNDFLEGKRIPINGLIWMDDAKAMQKQIESKIQDGFRCIKIKVGNLDFDSECMLLSEVRKKYSGQEITIRLDANGAFQHYECLNKLMALSIFNIHSIEQPIGVNQAHHMALLCEQSPIPIALDEELIGIHNKTDKRRLLNTIKPAHIVLKPTLHGGLQSCAEWIQLAKENKIGWWITSALESNIGLNAICQFTANYPITSYQGLGTGHLYENNIPSPLKTEHDYIYYDNTKNWMFDGLC